ncbi:MAG: flagellar M-ring protein FliF [Deltaproteobacteria bacterium]|nr:flagellar M-ring protein FliF [Deltaproteobacteria bacterium]
MEKLSAIFNKLQSQVSELWAKLSTLKKLSLFAAALLVAGTLTTVIILESRPDFQYLFTDLTPQDVTAIKGFMEKNNILDFVIDSKGIRVPVSMVDQLRLQLSQEGLPNQGVVGWEQFDHESFTRTEFEQEVLRQRAIQGELSRTISSIEGITSARVHIVMPRTSLFVREQKKPTAAIYINTKRGVSIDPKQIKGIQHLVSKSVEGLEPANITILNSEGKMLTEIEPEDFASKQSQQLLTYKQTIERTLEERIRAIVGKVVGFDRVEAKVDAQVDFTMEKQTISDIDPEDVVVISKNTTGFSMQGQGLNPTGIPGSKSNIPGEQEAITGASSSAGSKRDSEVVNYEFSKTVSEKTMSVGKMVSLSVSAIVDGKQIYPLDGSTPEFEARTPEEMKKIEELIKDAVGFKANRDSLTVHNMMFQLDPGQLMAIKEEKKEERAYLSTLALSAAIAIALVLFFAFVVRPYFRWLTYDPEKKEEMSIIEEYKPELETTKLQRVKVQEEVPFEKMTPKEQVFYLARHEPKRTTEALRLLINPTGSGMTGVTK